MKRFIRFFVLAMAMLMLSACASIQELDSESREVSDLLGYYARLSVLPADEQVRAYKEIQADFEREPDDLQRLRLALVLALPRAPWRDDAKVLKLVGSIVDAPAEKPSPRRNFAFTLQNLVQERIRLLREEQRKTEEVQQKLQGQLAERQRQLRDEQRKSAELQDKVNALRAIDRDTSMKPRPR
jgi:hypothetical protein